MTVYVSIGNSDDKLTQHQWSYFVSDVDCAVRSYASEIQGVWYSAPDSQYQNACWCFKLDEGIVPALQRSLQDSARRFNQDSVAWADARVTLLVAR